MNTALNIVVTGGNSGIGYETVKSLYEQGHNVVFGSRNAARNEEAVKTITQTKGGTLTALALDLSVRKSVEEFSRRVQELFKHIDILINNSGIMITRRELNQLGIEMILATNHFGHFYLTYLLWPTILKSPSARVINVSSGVHYLAAKNYLEDIECRHRNFRGTQQYAISKLFNVVFTQGLVRLLSESNITHVKAVCLHPGAVRTPIGSDSTFVKLCRILCCCIFVGQQEGARTSLYLSRAPFSTLRNGEYYDNNTRWKDMDKRARRPEDVQKLWAISQQAYGITWK